MAERAHCVRMKAQNLLKMVRLFLGFLGSWFLSRNDLVLENLVLRQQLAAFMGERAEAERRKLVEIVYALSRRMYAFIYMPLAVRDEDI